MPKFVFKEFPISASVAVPQGPELVPEPRPKSRLVKTSGTMHEDAYASDRSCARGPEGATLKLRVVTRQGERVALSPGFATLPDGRIVTLSCARNAFYLVLLAKTADAVLAKQRVPAPHTRIVGHIIPRKRARLFRRIVGSAYYFVEQVADVTEPYRVVLPTPQGHILRYRIGPASIREEDVIEMTSTGAPAAAYAPPVIEPDAADNDDDDQAARAEEQAEPPEPDAPGEDPDVMAPPVYPGRGGIVCVAPEDGETSTGYWVVYRDGTTCLVRPAAGGLEVFSADASVDGTPGLPPEIVANSICVGPAGAYVLTTRRLVRVYLENGVLRTDLGPLYPNLNKRKPGQLSPGSGTTPTLSTDGRFVFIVDNAKQMSLVAYDAKQLAKKGSAGGVRATLPVFGDVRECACENSVIAIGKRLVVGNTADYSNPFQWSEQASKDKPKGISVFHFDEESEALTRERTIEVDPGSVTMKASELDGRLYLYAPEIVGGRMQWSMRAYDPASGELVFKTVLFNDKSYVEEHDNSWATLALQTTSSCSRIIVGLLKGFAILEG